MVGALNTSDGICHFCPSKVATTCLSNRQTHIPNGKLDNSASNTVSHIARFSTRAKKDEDRRFDLELRLLAGPRRLTWGLVLRGVFLAESVLDLVMGRV